MQNLEGYHLWMRRSLSNLEKARSGRSSDNILYEDLCFDLQQSSEKSLKAVCILKTIIFQRTHDISYLIDILEKNGVDIPEDVKLARYLTQYAVETRYPGLYDPITEEEYREALMDSEKVFDWACKMTGFMIE